MSEGSRIRLSFDAAKCDGWGMCSLIFPEAISLDRWGFAHLAEGGVPGPLEPKARRAVACCPRQALAVLEAKPADL